MNSIVDETHDPALGSWVPSADGHPDFPIQNLPLGIFSSKDIAQRPGLAIGFGPCNAVILPAHQQSKATHL
jgi:hypothetical protein